MSLQVAGAVIGQETSTPTDIQRGGWVARLPEWLAPYALLMRLDRPIGSWLLLAPGLWSLCLRADGHRLTWFIVLFALGSVLMRGAGCVVNDMWDRRLDRQVSRTAARPLAAGTLSMWQAGLLLASLLSASLLILLQLNRLTQVLGVCSLVLVATYPLAKRITWWPQLMLGATFGWGAPMGYAAVAGRLDAMALLLYLAAICWTLGYDTIYAHQDRLDDALVGIRSTALLFARHTRPFLGACYGATVLLLVLCGRVAQLDASFYVAMALAAAMLAWQVLALDIDNPAGCLRLFMQNRDVGLMIAFALLAGRL